MYNFLSDAEWKGGFASFFQGEQPERTEVQSHSCSYVLKCQISV